MSEPCPRLGAAAEDRWADELELVNLLGALLGEGNSHRAPE